MNNKIYIVTSGEYSDYGIEAVFTTKEKAVEYVEQNGTRYNIEEYNLDEEVEKKTQLWSIEFCVVDGKLCEASPTSYDRNKVIDTCFIFDTFGYRKEIPYIRFYVDADAMDSAVKIARERFASVKSNDYIWLRLTRPLFVNGKTQYEIFNIKTNVFTKKY